MHAQRVAVLFHVCNLFILYELLPYILRLSLGKVCKVVVEILETFVEKIHNYFPLNSVVYLTNSGGEIASILTDTTNHSHRNTFLNSPPSLSKVTSVRLGLHNVRFACEDSFVNVFNVKFYLTLIQWAVGSHPLLLFLLWTISSSP